MLVLTVHLQVFLALQKTFLVTLRYLFAGCFVLARPY